MKYGPKGDKLLSRRLKKKRAVRLPLILILIASLTACFAGNTASLPAETEGVGVAASQEVRLTGYLIGEPPKGMPEVLEAVNAKLKKDVHATLEIHHIPWGDLATKYPLLLASGGDVDFIFAADWNFYVSEATKGAFLKLDEDMLRSYMPRHMAKLPQAALEAAKVDGQVFMIPTAVPDHKVNIALFRKDIMERAGLKAIDRFSGIEPYLAEVKRSYPEMIPLNLESQYDLPTPYHHLLNEKVGFPGAPVDSGDPLAQGIAYDNDDPAGRIVSMLEEPYLSAQKYAAGIMKDWYDKGYINKNPFANKIRSRDNFVNGKTGVAFGNSIDLAPVITQAKEKGIDVYIKPMLDPTGYAAKTSWINNGVAIAANSKHPQQTLEVLDLIMEDPDYVNLAYFGIEGKHYALTSDGKITLPAGVTNETNTYPPDAAGFWFVNKSLFKPMATWTDSYIELTKQTGNYLMEVPYLGFNFNSENIKAEVAAIKNASVQYAQPIYFGAVSNVDDAFGTLKQKLQAAGINKVKAEVERQAAAFLARKRSARQ